MIFSALLLLSLFEDQILFSVLAVLLVKLTVNISIKKILTVNVNELTHKKVNKGVKITNE